MVKPTDAERRYGFRNRTYVQPRPRPLFLVEFKVSSAVDFSEQELSRLSDVVKRTGRPSVTLNTNTKNQYNKTRLVHGKVEYQPITISFHDTADSPVLKLIKKYEEFYWGDFNQDKRPGSWNYDNISETFNQGSTGNRHSDWGLSVERNGSMETSYFFPEINIYEFYGDEFTIWNLVHPKITSIELDDRDITSPVPSEINMTLSYEGYTNYTDIDNENVISHAVTQELADRVGLRFTGESEKQGQGSQYTSESVRPDDGFTPTPVEEPSLFAEIGEIFEGASSQAQEASTGFIRNGTVPLQ